MLAARDSATVVGNPAARMMPTNAMAPAHAQRNRFGIDVAALSTRSVPSAARTASENIDTNIIVLGARKNLVPGTMA